MFKFLIPITASATLLTAPVTHADVEVSFVDSAPKDRFVLLNTGECALENIMVDFDLSKSVGKLIFDTTATGAGVEVFQPFEVRRGKLMLASTNEIKDGDSTLSLKIQSIAPSESVSFTIDVDDTLDRSELGNIRVSGSEITNGSITLITQKSTVSTTFNRYGKALLPTQGC
ncbi:hypothetical protein [Marinomonas algarum]|uniref:Aggregation factor core n=1 Tax=Marinomonas algarum TaxID=2883105 RepID=A0A9X1RW12_9GAMM|nr:hypothetical protein [Marinomonas algarum]MCB5163102.1 hypothetical protein [Marinomonas algarum]